ncbi:MAG: hypothetical protein SH859_07285 [Hyphomicrobium aestuarii]|nr:hypothetical protein [Hyphomicrobium aestuarii]
MMTFRLLSRLAVRPMAAMVLFRLTLLQPAVADDAYVCDGGRLFYAHPQTLSKLKAANVDPCNGRALDPARPQALQTPARANQPAPRPATSTMAPGSRPPSDPNSPLYSTPPPVAPRFRDATNERPASTSRAALPETVSSKPVSIASEHTNFRTVPILNAAPGQAAVYRHTR